MEDCGLFGALCTVTINAFCELLGLRRQSESTWISFLDLVPYIPTDQSAAIV